MQVLRMDAEGHARASQHLVEFALYADGATYEDQRWEMPAMVQDPDWAEFFGPDEGEDEGGILHVRFILGQLSDDELRDRSSR